MFSTRETLAALRTAILAVLGLSLLGTKVVMRFAFRRGLAPLDAMARDAQSIDTSTLERRFTTNPLPAELDPIRTRLNDLLARLQRAFERERRFGIDAAHSGIGLALSRALATTLGCDLRAELSADNRLRLVLE